jgi:hypothetical protein
VTTLTQPPLTAASVDDFVWKQWFQNTYRNVTELNEFAAGPIPIANGGTGETTANDAFNALAPSQTGNAGKILGTDGTDAGWGTPITRKNMITNGNMSLFQHAVSYTSAAVSSGYFGADYFWYLFAGGIGWTFQRITGTDAPEGLSHYIRCQRIAGSTNTGTTALGYDFLTQDGKYLGGRTVTLSFYYRAGANWSAGGPQVLFFTGTGTDQSRRLVVMTGEVITGNFMSAPTTSWQRHTLTIPCPADTNEATFYIVWSHSAVASGAADYVEFTGFQLEEGSYPTPFEFVTDTENYLRCADRFCKSFPLDTTPVVNLNSAERMYRMTAPVAGAVVTRGTQMVFPVRMRAVPTLTIYNPLAANNQAHDSSGALACTATSAVTQQQGFLIVTTGNAATAAGNSMVAGWTASAEI